MIVNCQLPIVSVDIFCRAGKEECRKTSRKGKRRVEAYAAIRSKLISNGFTW